MSSTQVTRKVQEERTEVDNSYGGSPPPMLRPRAAPCRSYNACRTWIGIVAGIAIVAGILAILAGSFDLSGVADAQTNGIMGVIAGSFAFIAGIIAAVLAWRCVGCRMCSLTPGCNGNYE